MALGIKTDNARAFSSCAMFKSSSAILGGGDVAFPLIFAGVILKYSANYFHALTITLGATIALTTLLLYSKKDKFYPAMPFISAGCFIALALIQFF